MVTRGKGGPLGWATASGLSICPGPSRRGEPLHTTHGATQTDPGRWGRCCAMFPALRVSAGLDLARPPRPKTLEMRHRERDGEPRSDGLQMWGSYVWAQGGVRTCLSSLGFYTEDLLGVSPAGGRQYARFQPPGLLRSSRVLPDRTRLFPEAQASPSASPREPHPQGEGRATTLPTVGATRRPPRLEDQESQQNRAAFSDS